MTQASVNQNPLYLNRLTVNSTQGHVTSIFLSRRWERPAARERRSLLAMGASNLVASAIVLLRALVVLLAFGLYLGAQAQSIAVQNLAVLVDADRSETIASVSAPAAAQRFMPLDGLLSAGYTRKVHWLRFSDALESVGRGGKCRVQRRLANFSHGLCLPAP